MNRLYAATILTLFAACAGPSKDREVQFSVPIRGPVDASFGTERTSIPLAFEGSRDEKLLSVFSEVDGDRLVLLGRAQLDWPASLADRTFELTLLDAAGQTLLSERRVAEKLPTTGVHHRFTKVEFRFELEDVSNVARMKLEFGAGD